MRWPAGHGLPLRRRGIAGTKEDSNLWDVKVRIGGDLTDLLQGLGKVLLYVVAQCLEGGYIDDLALVGEALRLSLVERENQ